MCAEPFRFAKCDRGGPQRRQLIGSAFQDRGALDKIEHTKP